jgi:hypothetical protein
LREPAPALQLRIADKYCFIFMPFSSQTSLLVVGIKIKTGLPYGGPACSAGAERGGFEPPVRLPVRQFSKLLV